MHRLRISLVSVVAGCLAAAPLTSADAAVSLFDDARHETSAASDIRWVRVHNDRDDDRFGVIVKTGQNRIGSTLVVFVDRNLRHRGPELRMVAAPDSEWSLFRVGAWGERGVEVSTCAGQVRMRSEEQAARWTASRSCLGIDGAVRVGAKLVDADGSVDWAPERRHFYPRVSARY